MISIALSAWLACPTFCASSICSTLLRATRFPLLTARWVPVATMTWLLRFPALRRLVVRLRNSCKFRMIVLHGKRLSHQSLDQSQLIPFMPSAERRGDARCSGTPGAANAVDVDFRHFRQLEVNHVRNAM